MTGHNGKKNVFLYHCEKAQKVNSSDLKNRLVFLFIDARLFFKSINDTFGHSTGDEVLKTIATNLQNTFGEKMEKSAELEEMNLLLLLKMKLQNNN